MVIFKYEINKENSYIQRKLVEKKLTNMINLAFCVL